MLLLRPIFEVAEMVFVVVLQRFAIGLIIVTKPFGTYRMSIKRYLLKKRQTR
jgi:hypothetical protein